MNSISFRPLTISDIAETVDLANRTGFGRPLTPLSWEAMEARNHVTYLAQDDGRIVGAIPFTLRDLAIAPEVTVPAAFAHIVCIDADYRGRGVGSGLMAWSFQQLAAFSDVACVYTGGEGHAPYRFYERNGYYDLLYAYRYDGQPDPQADMHGLQFLPTRETKVLESKLLRCFKSCYPQQAGFPRREVGYWHQALQSVIFQQGPVLLGWLVLAQNGHIEGYALLASENSLLKILELATLDAEAEPAHRLLQGASRMASEKGLERVSVYCSVKDPLAKLLDQQGWRRGNREVRVDPGHPEDPDPWERHRILAGRVLDFERLLDRSWPAGDNQGQLSLRVWTPETGPLVLRSSGSRDPTVNLEMKEETLHRLLLHRLDLHQSIQAECITVQSGTKADIETVARIFSPCPWVYFELDYI